MKQYIYKIQWLFPIKSGFTSTKKENERDLFNVINALGARSLTVVNFLDRDYKIVSNYSAMVQHESKEASKRLINHIKTTTKANEDILFVELLRK